MWKEKTEQESMDKKGEEQTTQAEKKGSPDFKTDVNDLISPATDMSSCEDGSVTQNSSSFFLTIWCGERWFAREGEQGGSVLVVSWYNFLEQYAPCEPGLP